jgi:hypothetical protein
VGQQREVAVVIQQAGKPAGPHERSTFAFRPGEAVDSGSLLPL